MSENQIVPGKNKKPKAKNKTLKSLFANSTSFSDFDPITGEKVAKDDSSSKKESSKAMANMEMSADARKTKATPLDGVETLRDAATGGSLSFLTSSSLLKNNKIKGAIGLAGAIGSGVLSAKKQMSDYNKQQGARETIAGKKSARSKAYADMINKKYKT